MNLLTQLTSVVNLLKRSFFSTLAWRLHRLCGLRAMPALVISEAPTTAADASLLTLSILQRGRSLSPFAANTITSVFPPSSNHCHLQTQQHVSLCLPRPPLTSPGSAACLHSLLLLIVHKTKSQKGARICWTGSAFYFVSSDFESFTARLKAFSLRAAAASSEPLSKSDISIF